MIPRLPSGTRNRVVATAGPGGPILLLPGPDHVVEATQLLVFIGREADLAAVEEQH